MNPLGDFPADTQEAIRRVLDAAARRLLAERQRTFEPPDGQDVPAGRTWPSEPEGDR